MGVNKKIEKRYTKDTDFILSLFFWGLAGISIYTALTTLTILYRIEIISSAIMNILAAIAFISRELPVENTSRDEYVIPILSFILPFIILNSNIILKPVYSTVFGLVIAIPSAILGIGSILTLRRSFAILPAVRKVVKIGPYNVIRHPLYLAELLYIFGFMMLGFSLISIALYVLCIAFTLWRIMIEEKKLRKYPEYRKYMMKVRYRLFPGIL